jgi:HEPN domain-containing protein
MSIACQQIAEKMLKHMLTISYNGSDIETLLKTHNLKKIYFTINGTLSSFQLDHTKLADLTDYYFDAKYPGDDYMDVTEEMFNGCFSTMTEVKNMVERFIF